LAIKFAFHEGKAVEALALIAKLKPGLTPLYVSKIFFYAEKWHLNRYGRPIVADTYIAMPKGPVPSTIKNFIDSNWAWIDKPEEIDNAIKIDSSKGWPRLFAGEREPNLSILSETDAQCLEEAVNYCKDKSPAELSALTYQEKSWLLAEANQAMDYEHFIDDDNPNRVQIVELAKVASAYGIL